MHVRPGSSLCRKFKHFVSPLILIIFYLTRTLTLTQFRRQKKQNIRNKTYRTKGLIVRLKLRNCHTKLCSYSPFQFQPFLKLKLGISSLLKEIPCFSCYLFIYLCIYIFVISQFFMTSPCNPFVAETVLCESQRVSCKYQWLQKV